MWRVSGTRKCSQHTDATYLLRRLVGPRRTLTTRRRSLGFGCDEELGVHGPLQRVCSWNGRRRGHGSCRQDRRALPSLIRHVRGASRSATGKNRHVRVPLWCGLLLRLVLLPLLLLDALGIEWVGKQSLLSILDLLESLNVWHFQFLIVEQG